MGCASFITFGLQRHTMAQDDGGYRSTRRTFLAATGLGATTAVAGCLGDDGGSEGTPGADGEFVMQTSTTDTLAYQMSQGIGEIVRQNTDEVRVEPRESEGTNANVGDLDSDSAQIVYLQNWTANLIHEGEEPFDQLSYEPYQVMHYYDLGWFLGTANEGWESVADIEPDSRVSPTPRGSGTAEMLEHALDYAVDDYERVSVGYGEQGSEMNDGSLDVGAATLVNFDIEPGWLEEMKSSADLRVLGWPEDALAEMEEDPGLVLTEVDMTRFEGFAYTPEAVAMPTLAYNFVVRDDLAYDPLYAFLETLWENRENLADYHAVLSYLEDGEFWVENAYENMPFHPAAADFYEEKGLWRDEFERGEEA